VRIVAWGAPPSCTSGAGEAFGEHPELPIRIDGAVHAVAPGLIGRLHEHLGSGGTRSLAVSVDVVDGRVERRERARAADQAEPPRRAWPTMISPEPCASCAWARPPPGSGLVKTTVKPNVSPMKRAARATSS